MDDLRESLNSFKLRGLKMEEVPKIFRKIAENLMCNYVIKKGKDKKYAIVEIEFYLYSNSHKDYITYPRKVEAGTWFFHQSGVDLSFKSENIEIHPKYSGNAIIGKTTELKKNPIFGGILIRGIYDLDKKKYIFGPLRCIDELWDNFDAFNHSEMYPIIERSKEKWPNNLKQCKRHINIKGNEKQTTSIKRWLERLGLTESDNEISDNEIKEYRKELFDDSEKFQYRFFNMQREEDKNPYNI